MGYFQFAQSTNFQMNQIPITKFQISKLSPELIESELSSLKSSLSSGVITSSARFSIEVGLAIDELGIVKIIDNDWKEIATFLSRQNIENGATEKTKILQLLEDAIVYLRIQLQEVSKNEFIRASEIAISRCSQSPDTELAEEARRLQADVSQILIFNKSRSLPVSVRQRLNGKKRK